MFDLHSARNLSKWVVTSPLGMSDFNVAYVSGEPLTTVMSSNWVWIKIGYLYPKMWYNIDDLRRTPPGAAVKCGTRAVQKEQTRPWIVAIQILQAFSAVHARDDPWALTAGWQWMAVQVMRTFDNLSPQSCRPWKFEPGPKWIPRAGLVMFKFSLANDPNSWVFPGYSVPGQQHFKPF